MAVSNREAAIKVTLGYEGGYTNHPSDPGGPTNWGITIYDARKYWKADATAADVKAMPLGVAIEIYRQRYWAAMNCDADPAGVDLVTFDYGVNSGNGRAVPCRARNKKPSAVDWVKAICAERIAFLHRLKTWSTFGKGWGRRVADVEARGVKMALEATEHSNQTIQDKLQTESKSAATQATKEVAKAGGTIAAPSSTQIPDAPHHVDVSSLDVWVLVAIGVIVAVGVAVFLWNRHLHKQREAAYAAVAKEV